MSQQYQRTPPEVYQAEAEKFRRRAEKQGRISASIIAVEGASEMEIQVPTRLAVHFARLALLLEEAARLAAEPPQAREFGPALQSLLNFCESLAHVMPERIAAGSWTAEGAFAELRSRLDDFAREDALARLQEDR